MNPYRGCVDRQDLETVLAAERNQSQRELRVLAGRTSLGKPAETQKDVATHHEGAGQE
jgi:hypothetical protein